MKKLILAVLALIVVLVIGVVVGVFVFIDVIAKRGIEQGATYALAVPTSLDSADVQVTGGAFTMSGLEVANPDGFDGDHFFALDSGHVAVELGSLTKETVRLPTLVLDSIDVSLVRKSDGTSNYGKILDNLKRFEGDPDKTPKDTGEAKTFIVDRIELKNIQVHASVSPLGNKAITSDIVIPEIILEDVGGSEGMPIGELANLVIKTVLTSAVQFGGDLPADLLSDLNGSLAQLDSLQDMGVTIAGDLKEQLEGAADDVKTQIEEGAEDVRKQVEDAAKDVEDKVKDGLKDLLPGGRPGGGG